MIFTVFLKPWPLQDELKFDHKSMKNWSKNQSKKLWNFDVNFVRFLIDFGAQVGSKIDQTSTKNQWKDQSKNQSKKWWYVELNCYRLFVDFAVVWGKCWGRKPMAQLSQEALFRSLWISQRQDGPKNPQRAPQDTPKSSQEPHKTSTVMTFGRMLDKLLVNLGLMLDDLCDMFSLLLLLFLLSLLLLLLLLLPAAAAWHWPLENGTVPT